MLYPSILDNARFVTDQTGSEQGGTDAQLIAALGPLYTECVRRLSKTVPDYYTYQVEGSLSGTPTTPVRKHVQIRKVERRVSVGPPARWIPVPPADPNLTGDPHRISWRAIGENLEILSPTSVANEFFRVEFIPNLSLPNAETHLDIPDGLDWYLAHQLAKLIRIRLDQSFKVHDDEATRIWNEVTTGLVPTTAQIRQVSDYDADEDY